MDDVVNHDWTGRTEEVDDLIDPSQVARYAATLGQAVAQPIETLPPLWHWAFFQSPLDTACLGDDGHPKEKAFLPPPANRSRMWAGGRVKFVEPLRVGIKATRSSTIIKAQEKTGSTGSLLFVTVQHDYIQDGRLAISEEQDIVFRALSPPKSGGSQRLISGDWQETFVPSPVALFRYSAVTFNAHRIHYDEPYATAVEGYPGLVVQGPLIATLTVAAFCRAHPDARLRHFAYRGLRPLIAPHAFEVGGRITGAGIASTWAGNESGLAQSSEIHFEQFSSTSGHCAAVGS
ncbi:MaoC family dehydratase N-terminal domain-containing protein [Pseudomonas sp. H9]|uniref:FAS1-like dehydratase domain-containing protein n=1 Tax=Pseudomonas sp. H9 TaxID=483968 RepID=UPI00105783DE|nr:MaoC family dehydratase N-terminal domain-containing protein [Pseudomonas sp. H9]TDF83882.1 transposase [Pseudomonas sp. H9]